MAEVGLVERSPWAHFAKPGRHGAANAEPGVVVAAAAPSSLVLLAARRGAAADLVRAARALGADLPVRPQWVRDGARWFIWAGPDQWLVLNGGPLAALQAEFEAVGADPLLVDQSHARAVLTLAGPRARDVLAKGVEIDLHPRAFKPGDVALTPLAQVSALLWQVDEKEGYMLAVPRSFAGSVWHWLTESAAEYGLQVFPAGESLEPR